MARSHRRPKPRESRSTSRFTYTVLGVFGGLLLVAANVVAYRLFERGEMHTGLNQYGQPVNSGGLAVAAVILDLLALAVGVPWGLRWWRKRNRD